MQRVANTNRFLTGCSSKAEFANSEIAVCSGGLLRHFVADRLAQTIQSGLYVSLTNELVGFAEQAFVLRNLNALEDVSHLLMNLPVDAARQIGFYYHALAINRKGRRDAAEALFEQIACTGPITYRARAIQTLGANYLDRGQSDETLRLQLEALRVASDKDADSLLTTVKAHFEIAVLTSIVGDHKGSLVSFGKLWPLVHCVAKQHPFYFHLYHNGLAVELAAAGRIAEAEAAISIALASPFAPAYPEWSETRDEIAETRRAASRSVVAIQRAPEADVAPQAESQRKPTQVIRVALGWPVSDKDFFQRSIVTISVTATLLFSTLSILDRTLICIGPRAPPIRT
jgi:tetratricopeptide (TPR) repeat protein